MRSATTFFILAISVWFINENLAQEPKLNSAQQYPDTHSERDQQGQQSQRSQTGPRGQKGQGRGGDRAANLAQLLNRMDRNGDEAISQDELPQRMQSRFESMDENGDGVLDKTEQIALLERIKKMRGDQKKEQGPNGQQGAGPKGLRRDVNFPQLLEKMDQNADGQLTKDELPERMQQRFESIDTNGNSVVDQDEQIAVIERLQQRGDKGAQRKRGGDPQDKQGVKPKRPGDNG